MRSAWLVCAGFAALAIAWVVWPTAPAGPRKKVTVPTLSRLGYSQDAMNCMENLRGIGTAVFLYAEDHDQFLPRADAWTDSTKKYISTIQMLKCPDATAFGYAFHRLLGGTSKTASPAPGTTPLVFDSSHLVVNANDDLTSLPKPPRHQNRTGGKGDLGLFLDGHTDWTAR